jgi:hypothetical protein
MLSDLRLCQGRRRLPVTYLDKVRCQDTRLQIAKVVLQPPLGMKLVSLAAIL